MKLILAALILFALPFAAAIDEEQDLVLRSESVLAEVSMHSEAAIYAERSDYAISYLRTNLTIVPKNYPNQDAAIISMVPDGVEEGNSIILTWESPDEGTHEIRVDTEVLVRRYRPEIKGKVPFPILVSEQEEYTKPTKYIDSNHPEIIEKASELAAGEEDLYEVVNNLAVWTNANIDYNLGTLTEDITQSASWVLKNRQGVCDELSALFIAMNRAVGIPARFVSGLTYTNSPLFEEEWGFHGWAEVYFPGYGWVPFDVTYGEYGYIDAGHIKLLETPDPSDTVTKYEWKGKNLRVVSGDLNAEVRVKKAVGTPAKEIRITAKPFEQEVGFGSYNAVEAEIENINDYYVSYDISVSKTENLEVIGERKKNVMLAPNEKKKVHFLLRVSPGLDKGYKYTFPVTVYSGDNMHNTSFKAASYGINVPLQTLENLEVEEEKDYRTLVDVKCSAEDIYEYEKISIICTLTNTGNTYIKGVSVCADSCATTDLSIGRAEKVSLLQEPASTGRQRIRVTAKFDGKESHGFADFTVLDAPEVEISEMEIPEKVKYGERFNISFLLRKTSASDPENLGVIVKVEDYEKAWDVESLENAQNYVLKMKGKDLREGSNSITIEATYSDSKGVEYKEQASAGIILEKLSFWQKIDVFFSRLFS
ncbi:transglutaminase domain-containing protein [Candidatus Woesearchaeota archaeon]|nr:transglutaminase domain-containing protein [Candidatus Woesearchaeota archaeon]